MSLRENNKFRIRYDIALATLTILVILFYNYTTYKVFYNLGLNNKIPISNEFFITTTLFCFIYALAVVIIYIYRLCIHLKKLKQLNRKEIYYRIIFTFLLLPLIFISGIYYSKPGYIYIYKGFSERMQREADISAIQDWLETIDTDTLNFNHNTAELSKSEQPDCIAKLSPKSVYIGKYDKNKIRVRLLWGGTLVGSWGLVVGSKTMTMPIDDLKRTGENRTYFASGAYIFLSD